MARDDLDDWLRVNWNRNYLRVFLGDPNWPRHDFRDFIYGRVGQPTANAQDEIDFAVSDLTDVLNQPVAVMQYTSGDYINKFRPKAFGFVAFCEPPCIDNVNHVYDLSQAPLGAEPTNGVRTIMLDNGVAIQTAAGLTVAAVSGNQIQSSGNHGMIANWRVLFLTGTPPAPLVKNVYYWVTSVDLAVNAFGLSLTRGGAEIVLSGSTTGAGFNGYGWDFDDIAGTATLVSAPAGRVLAEFVTSAAFATVTSAFADPASVYSEIVFTNLGLSANFKDQTSFDTLAASANASKIHTGIWLDTGKHTCAEAVAQLAEGTFTWYGFTPDGLMQVGMLDVPAATAVIAFTESDVMLGSLKLKTSIRAVDFSSTLFSYLPYFLTNGPLAPNATITSIFAQGKSFLAPYSYGAASYPIDSFPTLTDSNKNQSFDMLLAFSAGATAVRNTMANLFKKKIGVFEFKTRLIASQLSIGDTISLEHTRMGWKRWTVADAASPDNPAVIDSRLAVVIGIDVDLSADTPFPVTLTVYRQMPGFYPIADLN